MKRRDFVKGAALTTVGASLIQPLHALAASNEITHLESEDLSGALKSGEDFPLNFIALGDWGRSGEYNQLEVAKQMGDWATKNPNNFVISTGDNFYPKGVVSEHDPLWHYSFENIYTAHSLQCDWYPVLGNHDYGSSPDAQIKYSSVSRRWNLPARYYAKEVPLGKTGTSVLFLFIDTNPIVREEKEEMNQQLDWMRTTLREASPSVKWKIVIGHHPFFTVGPRIKNFDTLAVRSALKDLFEQQKVDVYLSGHEHSLQHLEEGNYTHQFISGAGSELTPVTAGIPYARYAASENGFMYFSVNSRTMRIKAVKYNGELLYETEIRAGKG